MEEKTPEKKGIPDFNFTGWLAGLGATKKQESKPEEKPEESKPESNLEKKTVISSTDELKIFQEKCPNLYFKFEAEYNSLTNSLREKEIEIEKLKKENRHIEDENTDVLKKYHELDLEYKEIQKRFDELKKSTNEILAFAKESGYIMDIPKEQQ